VLREHVAAHPLREHAQGLLMRALSRSGDTAGALQAYAEARAMLVEELGVEPGPDLRELHRAILNREAALDIAPTKPAASDRVQPRELPPDIGCFVGRDDETRRMTVALASTAGSVRSRPSVVVIHGPGGAGKSALAVHAAHAAARHFPGGQLYVDLFGSTPGLRALSVLDILGHLLTSLGVPRSGLPTDEGEAISRFRTLSSDRRLLIVLDNADDAGTILRVLPASGGSAVIITSRRPLATVEADLRVRLDGLSEAGGLDLLAQLTSGTRVEPTVASKILELCDHLPLAVRIVAGRLAGRPDLSPHDLADRLSDRGRRLDELELEGLAVRTCIRAGYEAVESSTGPLGQLAARAFRTIGLLNTPDVTPDVVAAMLTHEDNNLVKAALDLLVNVELLEPIATGRYKLHDLVRLVAAELAADKDDPAERERALFGGIAYYAAGMKLAFIRITGGRLMPDSREDFSRALTGTSDRLVVPEFPKPADASRWADAEHRCVLAAVEQASTAGELLSRTIAWCAQALWYHYYLRHDWVANDRLVDAVQRAGRADISAWAHLAVGRRAAELGRPEDAIGSFKIALAEYSAARNWEGVALAHNALGIATESLDTDLSLRHYTDFLEVCRRQGLRGGEALALFNIGNISGITGRLDEALAVTKLALSRREELNDAQGVGLALSQLAMLHAVRREPDDAIACADEALSWARQVGDQFQEKSTLLIRSEAQLIKGRLTEALRDAEVAGSLAADRGHRYIKALSAIQRSKILAAGGEGPQLTEADIVPVIVRVTAGIRRDFLLERVLLPG
jgi:tetratricopeptide (TPR) repeat protein